MFKTDSVAIRGTNTLLLLALQPVWSAYYNKVGERTRSGASQKVNRLQLWRSSTSPRRGGQTPMTVAWAREIAASIVPSVRSASDPTIR